MKRVVSLCAGVLFSVTAIAWADTHPAASCSRDAVNAAVTAASNGDVVTIPACPSGVTWTTALSVNKGITLQGAGIGQTVLIDEISNNAFMLSFSVNNNGNFRVTGIEFRGGANNRSGNGMLRISGNAHAFRVDHNRFQNWQEDVIYADGDLWGVIDHNVFDQPAVHDGIEIHHSSWGGVGEYGDNSWAQPCNFGSQAFIFIEDNTFNGNFGGATDGVGGGRFVFRRNNVNNDYVVFHGTESSGRERGVACFEIYNNTFTNNDSNDGEWFTANFIRSGTGVIYNNRLGGTQGYSRAVIFKHYRSEESHSPWGMCNGSGRYDQNTGSPTGYACIDQIGRTDGDLLSGDTPSPVGWPRQQLDPARAWSNTGFEEAEASADGNHVQSGRDFIVGAARPGYTPYPYPHPLTAGGGGPTSPAAPTNLRIVR
jgi:hypothetical protein